MCGVNEKVSSPSSQFTLDLDKTLDKIMAERWKINIHSSIRLDRRRIASRTVRLVGERLFSCINLCKMRVCF